MSLLLIRDIKLNFRKSLAVVKAKRRNSYLWNLFFSVWLGWAVWFFDVAYLINNYLSISMPVAPISVISEKETFPGFVRLVIKIAYIYFCLLISNNSRSNPTKENYADLWFHIKFFFFPSSLTAWRLACVLRKNKNRGSSFLFFFQAWKARIDQTFVPRKNWCFYVFLNWESFSTKHENMASEHNFPFVLWSQSKGKRIFLLAKFIQYCWWMAL